MFDVHKCYKWLDTQDPRLAPVDCPPVRPGVSQVQPLEVVCIRVRNIQNFLCILDSNEYNPLRDRARAILHQLESLKSQMRKAS